jgi:ABC-type sugar transport system permease subunit
MTDAAMLEERRVLVWQAFFLEYVTLAWMLAEAGVASGAGILARSITLLSSGFFIRRRWWIKALLAIYILPWALAAVQSFISFRWMLIGELGLVDRVLSEAFGIDGPTRFNYRWLALACNIIAYIWKWMPFWTVIFIAGRMTISQTMAAAILYALPPIAILLALRRYIAAGLTMGEVKQ